MTLLVVVVGLVTTVVAVSMVARRLGVLAPILLVVVGLALSFVAAVPQVRLDPEVVLIGVLPPLLYVAAVETSVPAFRYNLRPILLLAVGLVLFTTCLVAATAHAMSGMSWPAGWARSRRSCS